MHKVCLAALIASGLVAASPAFADRQVVRLGDVVKVPVIGYPMYPVQFTMLDAKRLVVTFTYGPGSSTVDLKTGDTRSIFVHQTCKDVCKRVLLNIKVLNVDELGSTLLETSTDFSSIQRD